MNTKELHEEIVTGVYNANDFNWEYIPQDFIDLWYENSLQELIEQGKTEEEAWEELEFWEGGEEQLIGDWVKNKDGLWEPDINKNGNNEEFAMIYDSNNNIGQVVWSRNIKYGRWAFFGCYPNQVDARKDDPKKPDSVCYVKYFSLPDYCLED